jgi:hypothetical protein
MDQTLLEIYERETAFSTFVCFQFGDTMEQVVTILQMTPRIMVFIKVSINQEFTFELYEECFHTLNSISTCVIIILCFCVCF